METTNSRKLAGLFFFVCAMIFGVSMYQIINSDPSARAGSRPTTNANSGEAAPAKVAKKGEPVSIQVDQSVLVGGSRIVFRGSADGRVHFDHYLLAFNPHYAFKYAVPVDKARDGFKIGARAYRVTHVGGGWVHLKVLEGAARG